MSVDYGKTTRSMTRFMNASRKLTGTILNKKPRAKTDSFDDPKLNVKRNGPARGRAFDDKLNNKPMPIRKKTTQPGKQSTKLTSSKNKPGNNKRNKGMVRKYK